jgi:hypothetical protein
MMATKRHTVEQIIHKLREAEAALSKGEPLSGLSIIILPLEASRFKRKRPPSPWIPPVWPFYRANVAPAAVRTRAPACFRTDLQAHIRSPRRLSTKRPFSPNKPEGCTKFRAVGADPSEIAYSSHRRRPPMRRPNADWRYMYISVEEPCR